MLCGRSRLALFASLQQETIMGTRTVSLLLAICAAGVWAPAHAQNADTSVVKLPQDIVYKRAFRSTATCDAVRRLFPARAVRRPHQIYAGHEGHAPLAS